MESSNTQPSRTTSSMNIEHEATSYENLKTHPPPNVEKIALHTTNKKLNSSSSSSSNRSSSPDSPLDDPFNNNDDDDNKSTSSSTNSSPRHERDRISATEAPPNQEMERSYRIPSSVFARSKSNTQMEWSVASNESLFSIHTGNMSFTNDQFMRSGELVGPGEASTSDQMFSYSAQETVCAIVADMRSRELGIAEATMKEVIQESEDQNYHTSLAEVRNTRRTQGSNTSTKSFAFSVMGGETEKGDSVKTPSSVRSSEEQTQSQLIKTESQQSTCNEPKTPAETETETAAAQSKWFSCLSCCSFC